MERDLFLSIRAAPEEVLTVEFHESVRARSGEEALTISLGLPHGANEVSDVADVHLEVGLDLCERGAFRFHDVGVAEDVLVGGGDNEFLRVVGEIGEGDGAFRGIDGRERHAEARGARGRPLHAAAVQRGLRGPSQERGGGVDECHFVERVSRG